MSAQLFRPLLDTLIPGGDGFPAASAVLTRARLAFRPGWTAAFDTIMAALPTAFSELGPAERSTALERLEATLPTQFQTLIEALYSIYYTDPEVLAATAAATGYRNPPQPGGYEMPPFDEAILSTVRNNPQSWRPTAPADHQGHA